MTRAGDGDEGKDEAEEDAGTKGGREGDGYEMGSKTVEGNGDRLGLVGMGEEGTGVRWETRTRGRGRMRRDCMGRGDYEQWRVTR